MTSGGDLETDVLNLQVLLLQLVLLHVCERTEYLIQQCTEHVNKTS